MERKRRRRVKHSAGVWALSVVWVALLVAASMPAQAHGGNHGTIKVHDEEDADPDERNEPHVDCDFWIEGFNMHGDSGSLTVYSWPPTGDRSVVLEADWEGEAEEGTGFHFLSGPHELPDGHYRVEAFSDAGHPGDHDHFAKAKMFWVDCETDDENGPPEECPPTELSATALGDSSIRLTFVVPDGADGMNIYRAEGGGAFEYNSTTGPEVTEFLDTDTEVGVTYTYLVAPLFGEREAQGCETVEVTAIPVFPSWVAGATAATLAVGAYAWSRRRQA